MPTTLAAVQEPAMATVAASDAPTTNDPSPAALEAFLADRQAFWGSFTRFVTFGAGAVVVLLVLMAIFLT
jgi:hypothetical protein